MGSLFFSSDFGAADKWCQVEHPTPKSSSLGQVRRRHQRHIRDHATEWPRSQPPRSSQPQLDHSRCTTPRCSTSAIHMLRLALPAQGDHDCMHFISRIVISTSIQLTHDYPHVVPAKYNILYNTSAVKKEADAGQVTDFTCILARKLNLHISGR